MGIAAPTRFNVRIEGLASRSGTTPMGYRKDAFLGTDEIALVLESAALSEALNRTVATIGVCDVLPGAMNVVPGLVEIKVDIRGTSGESKENVINELTKAISEIEEKRGLKVTRTKTSDELPIEMDQDVVSSLKETCEGNAFDYAFMTSGGGHDAMNMAKLCLTGLFFIPSKNGLSHNPDEYSSTAQMAIGAALLEKEVLKWAII